MQARLIHPWLDPFLMGGLPIVLSLLGLWMVPEPFSAAPDLIALSLILFSYPHFIASYFIFYKQEAVFKKHRVTALLSPVLLLSLLALLIVKQQFTALGWMGQVGLVLLLWHYVKQSYGCCIWLGKIQAREPNLLPRRALLLSCLLLGTSGFFQINGAAARHSLFAIALPSLPFPSELVEAIRIAAAASVLCCVLILLQRWAKGQVRGACFLSLLPLFALLTWMEPLFQSPLSFALLPFVHGVQYFPFLFRRLWNHQKAQRSALRIGGFGLLGVSFIGLGFLLFVGIPRWGMPQSGLGVSEASSVFSALLLFFNIHHYFIDATLWRLSSEDVRKGLLGSFEEL